jgi:Lrp/AsnC family leucine-responsive transcriptional regulator
MDKIDLQILEILQKKARIPNVEVARTIGMAPSAVLERIKKLEASGVIQGYEVRLNPDMFQCAMVAFIEVHVSDPACIQEIGRVLSGIDQGQEVHYLAGRDCLMAKLRTRDTAELETLLVERINNIRAVSSTRTLIALSTYKESAKIAIHPIP